MIIEILLLDRTTGRNILWANSEHGAKEIQRDDVFSIVPRWQKNRALQKSRTRARAEIFTPPEVCKLQNDTVDIAWLKNSVEKWFKENCNLDKNSPTDKAIIDGHFENIAAAWFWQEKIFPAEPDKSADTYVANWLDYADSKDFWETYVTSRRLEITCGEAPYVVSRYNAATGEPIPLAERVGLLDRKLRVVSSRKETLPDWIDFATQALQSVYGYELQGDNLFLARRNVFDSVVEYFTEKFSCKPPEDFLSHVAKIISWNFWQMDGLSKTYSPPFTEEANLFGGANCLIKDWLTGEEIYFRSLV